MVGREVRLALDGVDDDDIDGGTGTELDVSWETGAAHADDAGLLYAGHNLLRLQGRIMNNIRAAVDARFPFVAFNIDDNGGFAIAAGVNDCVDFGYLAGHGRVDGSRDKSSGIGNLRTHFHKSPFSYAGDGRGAYML